MTVSEKLALMERLWDDLSRCPENVPSPEWHGDVLAERIAAVREGRTRFVDWDQAKRRLRERLDVYAVLDCRQNPATIQTRLESSRPEDGGLADGS